jgi:hypothetical protein
MLMTKFLELILIVLILRTVLSMVLPLRKRKVEPVSPASREESGPFSGRADISDGEFEELK